MIYFMTSCPGFQEAQYFAVGGSDVTRRSARARLVLLLNASQRWTHIIDRRCRSSRWLPSLALPSVSPSAFLPLYVCSSHPLCFFSPPSFCLSQAPHFSSSSICHPSPYPLLFRQPHLQRRLFCLRQASPPSDILLLLLLLPSLSVLRRHL